MGLKSGKEAVERVEVRVRDGQNLAMFDIARLEVGELSLVLPLPLSPSAGLALLVLRLSPLGVLEMPALLLKLSQLLPVFLNWLIDLGFLSTTDIWGRFFVGG